MKDSKLQLRDNKEDTISTIESHHNHISLPNAIIDQENQAMDVTTSPRSPPSTPKIIIPNQHKFSLACTSSITTSSRKSSVIDPCLARFRPSLSDPHFPLPVAFLTSLEGFFYGVNQVLITKEGKEQNNRQDPLPSLSSWWKEK